MRLQTGFLEEDLDAVGAKGALVLADDAPLRALENFEEVGDAQFAADHADRETADELGLEAIFHKISGGDMLEHLDVTLLALRRSEAKPMVPWRTRRSITFR